MMCECFVLLALVTSILVILPSQVLSSCSGLGIGNTCPEVRIEPGVSFASIKQQLCPTTHPMAPPPQFMVQPSNQNAKSNTKFVEFECGIVSSTDTALNITWEHNGQKIRSGEDNFSVTTNATSSVLRVLNVSIATEGAYRCIVAPNHLMKYFVTSRYGYLQIHRCSGWIDTVLSPSHSSDSTVDIEVAKGGSTVLECVPNTTLSSPHSYVWLRDKNATLDDTHTRLPNGRLLIRDFDPPPGGVANYRCIIVDSNCGELVRSFTVRTYNGGVPLTIAPSNQTVTLGSANVTFYCLTNSKSGNTWYKDNHQPLDSLRTKWTVFGARREVLVLSEVTMETGGVYSCVGDEDFTLTAHLTVLAPPGSLSIQAVGHTSSNGKVSVPRSEPLLLTCSAHSLTDTTYSWFFDGEPISAPSAEEPFLNVTWGGVFGSYQCLASNRAGSALATLYVYEDTGSGDEGVEPPSSVSLSLVRDTASSGSPDMYKYHFKVYPPTSDPLSTYNYAIEVIVYETQSISYKNCSCILDDNISSDGVGEVNFWANDFIGKRLFFRAAALSSSGARSDFVTDINTTCDVTVSKVAPPPPIDPLWTPVLSGSQWDVTLSWRTPTDDQYPFDEYRTSLTMDCQGRDILELVHGSKEFTSYSLTLPPCTACNWSVTFITLDGTLSTPSELMRDQTQAIRPQPPILNSVARAGSNGQSLEVEFTLHPEDISCDNDLHFMMSYSDKDSLPLTCSPLSEQNRTYGCEVRVSEQYCWQPLDVSVEVGNEMGLSDPSSSVAVTGIGQEDLSGFSDLTVTTATDSSLTLSLQITDGLKCLLTHHPNSVNAHVCLYNSSDHPLCQNISATDLTYMYPFHGLRGSAMYHVEAVLSVTSVGSKTLSVNESTLVGVPSVPPQDLTIKRNSSKLVVSWAPPSSESSNGDITHYELRISSNAETHVVHSTVFFVGQYHPEVEYTVTVRACTTSGCGPEAKQTLPPSGPSKLNKDALVGVGVGVGVGVAVLVVVIVFVLILILILCYVVKRHRMKKKDYERERLQLHTDEDNQIHDRDLVSVRGADGTAESIHSDHTILNGTIKVDKLSMCQEFIDKHRHYMGPEAFDDHSSRGDMEEEIVQVDIHSQIDTEGMSEAGEAGGNNTRERVNERDRKSDRGRKSRRSKSRGDDMIPLIEMEEGGDDPSAGDSECVSQQSPGRKDWNEHLKMPPTGMNGQEELHLLEIKGMEQFTETSGLITRESDASMDSTSLGVTMGGPDPVQTSSEGHSSGYVVDDSVRTNTHTVQPQKGYGRSEHCAIDIPNDSPHTSTNAGSSISDTTLSPCDASMHHTNSQLGYVTLQDHPQHSPPHRHTSSAQSGTLPSEAVGQSTHTTEEPEPLNPTTHTVTNTTVPPPPSMQATTRHPLNAENEDSSYLSEYSQPLSRNPSSQGYVSQFELSQQSHCMPNFSNDQPETLSQDSVFDGILDSDPHETDCYPSRTTTRSSGIYSTSSDVNEYMRSESADLEGTRHARFSRCPSEGYMTARNTPNYPSQQQFDLPELNGIDKRGTLVDCGSRVRSDSSETNSVKFEPPSDLFSPSPDRFCLSSLSSSSNSDLRHLVDTTDDPYRLKDYCNTEDLNLSTIKLRPDESMDEPDQDMWTDGQIGARDKEALLASAC